MCMKSNLESPLSYVDTVDRNGQLIKRRVQRFSCVSFVEHVEKDEDGVDVHTHRVMKEPSLTRQEFLPMSDINNIIKRYKVTGVIPQMQAEPLYGDFSSLPDYQQSLDIVLRAQKAFEALPSEVRTRFQNDPAEMVAFCADPANTDEARRLGLLKDPVDPETTLKDIHEALKASAAERSGARPPSEGS